MLTRSSGRTGPVKVDLRALAANGGVIEGAVEAGAFPRLADRILGDAPSRVTYALAGSHDAHGRPAVIVRLEGNFRVLCGRCLEPMDLPISTETRVSVAGSAAELAAWDADEEEVMLASPSGDSLDELLEDELLLALPFSPRHEEPTCTAQSTK